MKYQETALIKEQREIAPGVYSLWLQTEHIAEEARPGQFVSVYCHDESRLLPRPISICEIDKENKTLRLVYRKAGAGTAEFPATARERPYVSLAPWEMASLWTRAIKKYSSSEAVSAYRPWWSCQSSFPARRLWYPVTGAGICS